MLFCYVYNIIQIVGEREKRAINETGSVVEWIESNGLKRPHILSRIFSTFRELIYDAQTAN